MAHKDCCFAAKLFKHNAREKLVHDPEGRCEGRGCVGRARNLSHGLSSDQRHMSWSLPGTHEQRGVTADVDGETVSFL